jgi:hypothetical protein
MPPPKGVCSSQMSAGLMRSNESAGCGLTSSAMKFRVLSQSTLTFLNQIVVILSGIPARLDMARLLEKLAGPGNKQKKQKKNKPTKRSQGNIRTDIV